MAGTSTNPNPKNSAPYDDCDMMKPYEFFFNRFPWGFMFQPSDEELILQYLMNKLLNKPLPTNKILDLKIYNFTPMQLADMHKFREEEAMYFFSPRDRKYPNGNRPNRITGDGKRNGFWKATGKDKQIFDERNKVIGARKALVFYEWNSNPEAEKTDWIMHEFKIHENIIAPTTTARAPGDKRLDDWVLCKVYLSKMAKPNPNTRDEAENTEMIDSKPLEQDLPLFESSAIPNLGEQVNMNNQSVQPFNNGIMTVPYGSATGFVSQEVTNLGPRSHADHRQNLSLLPSSSQQQVIDSVSSAISSLAGGDNNNGMITTPYGYADGLNGSEVVINFGKNLHADQQHNSLMPSDSAIASLAAGPVLPRGMGAQFGTNIAPTNGIPAYQSYQSHGFGAQPSLPSFENGCLPPLPQGYYSYDDLGYGSF